MANMAKLVVEARNTSIKLQGCPGAATVVLVRLNQALRVGRPADIESALKAARPFVKMAVNRTAVISQRISAENAQAQQDRAEANKRNEEAFLRLLKINKGQL